MAHITLPASQTPLERGEALKKGDDAPRQKYTRLFYTDATGKITAFTITLFERTATGANGKQLAYTREQWKEIVEEKKKEMRQAAVQAAGGNTATPDLFTGIAGFESSADETTGVKFSIPSTTPPTAGNPPPAPLEITIQSSTNRARDFNTLAHAMDPRDASELRDSRVSADRSERASLPDWWDTTMEHDLTKEQINAVLAAPSIGIRNDGSGNTCFFNTMFNAYILHDRELIDALLAHRNDMDNNPTKQIAMYLYNYIKHRSKHLDSSLSFINTEQFRKDLDQIAPTRGYLSGQHDACQAYQSLRSALEPKGKVGDAGWLKEEKCTVTQRTYYQAPKPTDHFYTQPTTLNRPVPRTTMDVLRRKPPKAPVPTAYDLHAGTNSGEAFSQTAPDPQNPTIHISLPKKSKSPLNLDELVRDQYFNTPATADSETVLQPIITGQDDAIGSTTMELQPCKQLRQTRLLSEVPPKILIFEFDGSGDVTIPAKYTLASAYRQKATNGTDAPAVQYALKSATVRPGDSPTSGGHYYSYDQRGTKWYRTNDSVATEITEAAMLAELSKTRRSLVYERIDAAPAVVVPPPTVV